MTNEKAGTNTMTDKEKDLVITSCETTQIFLQKIINYCTSNNMEGKEVFNTFCHPLTISLLQAFCEEIEPETQNNLLRQIEQDALSIIEPLCKRYGLDCQLKTENADAINDFVEIRLNDEPILSLSLFHRTAIRTYNEHLMEYREQLTILHSSIIQKEQEIEKLKQSTHYTDDAAKINVLLNRTIKIKKLRKRYGTLMKERGELMKEIFNVYLIVLNELQLYLPQHCILSQVEDRLSEIKGITLVDPLNIAALQELVFMPNE